MRIGFIGTGTISAAVVSGLQSLPNAPDVIVSPRSEAVSEALAARYPKVHRAGSNAEVATADIVFLGMRPMHLEEAMAGIDFKAGQIVASMVAGFSLADVQARWPEATVCRFIPLPGIAHGKGPMATYPEVPEIVRLFTPLGDLFVAPDEARIHFGGLNSFMSSYFELQRALIDVGTRAGISEPDARRFVVSMLGMLADTAQRTPANAFDQLVEEHQTRGGLNERVRAA
ncbi:MAG TPA: NAD(P)-binding domain-containing protein, partial [Devosia sp.]|nr:NAD(P)-binding domain-containing protein [Devosia sp.]